MRLPVLLTLCCVLKLCVIVQGLYQVEARLLGYENPTQTSFSDSGQRRCCDIHSNSGCAEGQCDSFFTYCLRAFGDDDSQEGGCSNRERMTSDINGDDESIDFSRNRVLGLDNPFHLQGFSNDYTGVQLYIDIQDEDSGANPDDFIDALLINYNQTVGMPQRQTYSGIHGFVTMDLNITVFCVGNFAEPDCSSQCVTGFTGPDCQTVDYCVGVNCNGNGLCVNGPGMDSFMCNCSAGYNGSECEMNIDDCLSNPCASTGQCVDGVDSFTCSCDQGYTGQLCETDIDECEGVNCSGNGKCLDGVGSFSCVCSPGYTGQLCDVDIQEPSQSGSRVGSVLEGIFEAIIGLILIIGSVAGGVVGAVVGLILIIVIVVVVVLLVLRWRNRSGGMKFRASLYHNNTTFYGEDDESSEATYTEPFGNPQHGNQRGIEEDKFDNPLYSDDADDDDDGTYSVPCDSHNILLS